MNVAILSGKGGTGKTLVSVNLAAAAEQSIYIDCDVEEPNGHLFFKPENISKERVSVLVPEVDPAKCIGCRDCVNFCKFNALAYGADQLLIFEEVCHSCGGCMIVCPENALSEHPKIIGNIQKGNSQAIDVYTGMLNIGEVSGVPIIKRLLEINAASTGWTFVDCPPGSSCNVMESIEEADYCILVAEPTLFGVHNFEMVYELVILFQKPFGVILNKVVDGENPSELFCKEKGIPIIARLPFDNDLGKMNSDAKIAVHESEQYRTIFTNLLKTIEKEVHHETAAHIKR